MNLFEWLMFSVVGLTLFVLLAVLLLTLRETRNTLKEQAAANLRVQEHQLELLDKGMAMIRASDPWQYQQIQAVSDAPMYDEFYDPSPEAEAQRIAERDRAKDQLEEDLNAEERAALSDIFPGL